MYAIDAKKRWQNYQGSQRKPADFETFWQAGFQEVDDLGTDYHLEPHPLNSSVAEAFDLTFTGVQGATVHCQLIRPKRPQKKSPLLFQFHGYHSDAGDWTDKVAMAAEGFWVVALDVRGQGGLSEDVGLTTKTSLKGHIIRGVESGPKELFYRSVFLDIYQLTRLVLAEPQVDSSKLYAYGASQGGALALICAAVAPEIKESFVCYPFLSDYREAYRLDVENSAYEELAYWFRFKDPLHQREEAFFETLDYIDLQYFAPWIKGKVHWAIGLADTVCPPKTQFAVYNQLSSAADKEMLIYPEYGHEYLPKFGDHMWQCLADGSREKE
jgi:cephalosporin-C deacetylase